ncbi:nodulation protein NodZ [Arthrospira platensis SPKY2]
MASALGFIGSQNSIKQIIAHPSSSHILAYPTEINLDKSSSHFQIISNGLSKSLCSFIFNNGVGYKSKKNIALYWETGTSGEQQDRRAVFISRDNLPGFYLPKEDAVISKQRLYSRIIPSNAVLKQLAKLEKINKLEKLYETSLGVHVRHGNGERYFHKNTNTWGVKPPNSKVLLNAIDSAMANSSKHIENIILASDSWSVKDFFDRNFGDKVNVVFISNNIKKIGAGCNHNNHKNTVFDPELAGISMDRQEEEILAFSEILALSKCCALCGGSSYFFEAVIGFSSCSEDQIFKIDNLDRYIVLNDNCQPLFESNNHLSDLLIKKIKDFGGFIDGIFIDEKSTEDSLKLSYFDDVLYLGSFYELMQPVIWSNFYDRLKYFRLY